MVTVTASGYCQEAIINPKNLGTDMPSACNVNTRVKDLIAIGGSGGEVGANQADNPGSWGAVVGAYLGFE